MFPEKAHRAFFSVLVDMGIHVPSLELRTKLKQEKTKMRDDHNVKINANQSNHESHLLFHTCNSLVPFLSYYRLLNCLRHRHRWVVVAAAVDNVAFRLDLVDIYHHGDAYEEVWNLSKFLVKYT